MRAAIVSVGDELLLGDQVDTNAVWLARQLSDLGIRVVRTAGAGDGLEELTELLAWLFARHDLVLIGGGLGPTHDDRTREAVAAAAGVPLERREDLEEALIQRFASYGVRMPPGNLKQAEAPAGATSYPAVGTAPTFSLEVAREDGVSCLVHVLPGVPWEMRELFERDVLPDLLARTGGGATVTRVVHVGGRGESAVAEDLRELLERVEASGEATIAFLAKQTEIQVRITVTAADPEAARVASQPLVDEVVQALGAAVAGVDREDLEEAVARLLAQRGRTVATAESCTAGQIASRIARVPGTSELLRGGMVTYATDTKVDVLGVEEDLVEEHGPVSEQVTARMAERAREVFDADYGLAVTCAAGPSGQGDAEPGDSYWALARPDGQVEVHGRHIPGDRETVRSRLGSAALDLLRRRLVEEAS